MEMNEHDTDIDQYIRHHMQVLEHTYPTTWTPTDVLWEKLQYRRQKRHSTRWMLSTAASILIVVAAGWVWQQTKFTRDTTVLARPVITTPQEDNALTYIHDRCKANNIVCATPDFQALENDLAAAIASLDQVNQALSRFGQDEHLLRAKERIETHQGRIIRAMVQML
jgi:hypothetical protein